MTPPRELLTLLSIIVAFAHGWCFSSWLNRRGIIMPIWQQNLFLAAGGAGIGYLAQYIFTGET